MKKSKWGNKNFFSSVKCTLEGIFYAICHEKNFKIQLVFAVIAIICGIITNISHIEWCIIVMVIFMVLSAELFNTAIETAIDLYTQEYNEFAKIAKDVSSGAVLLTAICSVIIGIIIFLPKIIDLICN